MTKRSLLVAAALLYLGYMIVRNFWAFTAVMQKSAFTQDLGWLVQAGRDIVAHARIPAHDVFSWTAEGRDWLLYQWLFEVGLAFGERLVGIEWLVRATMLVGLAAYIFLPALGGVPRRVPLFLTLLVGSTALFIVSINLSLRPMLVTTLFLAVQLVVIERHRRGAAGLKAVILVLAPLYALWGNMHTGVVLGLGSLAFMAAGDALQRRGIYRFAPADPGIEGAPLGLRAYALIAGAGFAASLANPYGVEIYPYLAELSLKHELNAEIVELQAARLRDVRVMLLVVCAGAALLLLLRARRVFAAHEILHLAVLTVATLVTVRFIVWAALFYALILPKGMYQAWVAARDRYPTVSAIIESLEPVRRPFLAATAAVGLAFALVFADSIHPFRHGACAEVRPGIEAYQGLKTPADRLFTDPRVGSCSLYWFPDTNVFIDTRFDFYDQRFALATLGALRLEPGWRAFLDEWRIDTFLMVRRWPLARRLRDDDGARILYEDEETILVRTRPAP